MDGLDVGNEGLPTGGEKVTLVTPEEISCSLVHRPDVLAQHLRVAGDNGKRSIDLVGYTCREQTNGGELLRLCKLCLHL